ncbi:hypothetical protein [Actinoplanes awajinensis]|uniref:Uncharacterized protein n=1 Tax=Actinoplanes awajinensis subsp. mycoplanecinus TaxID=135947 RepID=A0A0X3UNP8_9ACTN|nr:hypothetical protein [Actinoplanes awajinensis]KUL34249.1 hypothetical protein ADL15_16580 [Actinoplanes awajinensis subsp. mycoplanecinus]
MPLSDPPVVYRIERHAPDILRLFRNGHLVDTDVEHEGDSRADIERWGTGVAWAEDHTGIARWDAQPAGADRWQVLVGVAYRYVHRQFENVSAWDEVGPNGEVSRHIEAAPDGRYLAATASSETLAARESGRAAAVAACERTYGVAQEAESAPEAEHEPTPITGREFIDRWLEARHALNASPTPIR